MWAIVLIWHLFSGQTICFSCFSFHKSREIEKISMPWNLLLERSEECVERVKPYSYWNKGEKFLSTTNFRLKENMENYWQNTAMISAQNKKQLEQNCKQIWKLQMERHKIDRGIIQQTEAHHSPFFAISHFISSVLQCQLFYTWIILLFSSFAWKIGCCWFSTVNHISCYFLFDLRGVSPQAMLASLIWNLSASMSLTLSYNLPSNWNDLPAFFPWNYSNLMVVLLKAFAHHSAAWTWKLSLIFLLILKLHSAHAKNIQSRISLFYSRLFSSCS